MISPPFAQQQARFTERLTTRLQYAASLQTTREYRTLLMTNLLLATLGRNLAEEDEDRWHNLFNEPLPYCHAETLALEQTLWQHAVTIMESATSEKAKSYDAVQPRFTIILQDIINLLHLEIGMLNTPLTEYFEHELRTIKKRHARS